MGRRALLVIAAMLVAAVGVGLIALYVQGADTRANKNAATVDVWVAKSDIAKGTAADLLMLGEGLVEKVPVVQKFAGSNSIVDADLSAFKGRVLLERVSKGQPLQRSMFGTASGVSTDAIGDKKMAVAITMSDPARVAGLIVPGSKVTIFRSEGTGPKRSTTVLLYDVTVLGANGVTPADIGNGKTAAPKTQITFALTTEQAGRVIFAASSTDIDLWLGLQGSESAQRLQAAVDPNNLLSEAK